MRDAKIGLRVDDGRFRVLNGGVLPVCLSVVTVVS